MKLGQKIREYRQATRMTQGEFAELAGLTREQVNAIENEYNKNPGMETLIALAKAMEITLDELVKE